MALRSGSPHHTYYLSYALLPQLGGEELEPRWLRVKAAPVPGHREDPATSRTHWMPQPKPPTQKTYI